jgi:hypothetical protein
MVATRGGLTRIQSSDVTALNTTLAIHENETEAARAIGAWEGFWPSSIRICPGQSGVPIDAWPP